jgi:hypothetical protein
LPGGALFETLSLGVVSDTSGRPLAHLDGGASFSRRAPRVSWRRARAPSRCTAACWRL